MESHDEIWHRRIRTVYRMTKKKQRRKEMREATEVVKGEEGSGGRGGARWRSLPSFITRSFPLVDKGPVRSVRSISERRTKPGVRIFALSQAVAWAAADREAEHGSWWILLSAEGSIYTIPQCFRLICEYTAASARGRRILRGNP